MYIEGMTSPWGCKMIPLVEFPERVQYYAPYFKDVFSEAGFVEFKHYIGGLIVSENKAVEGINCLFVTKAVTKAV